MMTTFAEGLAVPGSPATLETSHELAVGRRPQPRAVTDADHSGVEVVGAVRFVVGHGVLGEVVLEGRPAGQRPW